MPRIPQISRRPGSRELVPAARQESTTALKAQAQAGVSLINAAGSVANFAQQYSNTKTKLDVDLGKAELKRRAALLADEVSNDGDILLGSDDLTKTFQERYREESKDIINQFSNEKVRKALQADAIDFETNQFIPLAKMQKERNISFLAERSEDFRSTIMDFTRTDPSESSVANSIKMIEQHHDNDSPMADLYGVKNQEVKNVAMRDLGYTTLNALIRQGRLDESKYEEARERVMNGDLRKLLDGKGGKDKAIDDALVMIEEEKFKSLDLRFRDINTRNRIDEAFRNQQKRKYLDTMVDKVEQIEAEGLNLNEAYQELAPEIARGKITLGLSETEAKVIDGLFQERPDVATFQNLKMTANYSKDIVSSRTVGSLDRVVNRLDKDFADNAIGYKEYTSLTKYAASVRKSLQSKTNDLELAMDRRAFSKIDDAITKDLIEKTLNLSGPEVFVETQAYRSYMNKRARGMSPDESLQAVFKEFSVVSEGDVIPSPLDSSQIKFIRRSKGKQRREALEAAAVFIKKWRKNKLDQGEDPEEIRLQSERAAKYLRKTMKIINEIEEE